MHTKKIVHLITHEKFTADYINFMKIYMKDYEHIFILTAYSHSRDENIDGKLVDENNIIRYSGRKRMLIGRDIRKIIEEADKIIVSGIFGIETIIYYWPCHIFKKMYLHYWGGDFYPLRKPVPLKDYRRRFHRYMLKTCFKRSAGAIFLIDGEYEVFKTITGITKKRVFTAAMPHAFDKDFLYLKYRNASDGIPLRIILGNSATSENQHKYVFEILQHLKDENIEIFCPLSYGDEAYGKDIAILGEKIFGSKFHPIFEWISMEKYIKFLSTFDIGIFGCDRQQAMGNINSLLRLGKKVYLRSDTSMFFNYTKVGFKCYDIETIRDSSVEDLKYFPEKNSNEKIADSWNTVDYIRAQWSKIFEYK